jgi:hypothetical protein
MERESQSGFVGRNELVTAIRRELRDDKCVTIDTFVFPMTSTGEGIDEC